MESSLSASFLSFLNYGFVYKSPERNSSIGSSSVVDWGAARDLIAEKKPISR
jgi:hypothetical protein